MPPAALKRHTRVHKTGKRWLVYTNLNNSHVDVVLLYGMYTWNDEKQGNGFIPFCFLCTELYLTLRWNKTTSVYFRHTLLTLLQTSLVCTREIIRFVCYWKRYFILVMVLSWNKCSLSWRIFSYCAQIYVINGGYLPPNVYIMRSVLMCNIENREFLSSMFFRKTTSLMKIITKQIVWRYCALNIAINIIRLIQYLISK